MKIVSLNVRGLGSSVKRVAIKTNLILIKSDITLFQEAKMAIVNESIIRSLQPYEYVVKPSVGATGGSLVTWNSFCWMKKGELIGDFSKSILLLDLRINKEWRITLVYGPIEYLFLLERIVLV